MTNDIRKSEGTPEKWVPKVTYKVKKDCLSFLKIDMYVDGSWAGECIGYPQRGNHHRIIIYPRRVIYPYSRMNLPLKAERWRHELG